MPGLHPHPKWTDVPRILPVGPFLGHTGTLKPRERSSSATKWLNAPPPGPFPMEREVTVPSGEGEDPLLILTLARTLLIQYTQTLVAH